MFDYLRKFYDRLVSSVLDPVAEWVLALSWAKRCMILLFISIGFVAWRNPAPVKDAASFLTHALRVARAGSTGIPLTTGLSQHTSSIRARLLATNSNDVNLVSSGGITGWSSAQILMAISRPGKATIDEERLIRYIRATRLPGCNCWPELNGDDERHAWTFVSGWVMAALARKQVPASAGELAFLLDQQNPDGSWSSIPQQNLSAYASVYTTAWAVIGLLAQAEAGLLPDQETASSARASAKRGAAWLLNNRLSNARWKSYPNLQSSSISESISGVAMHALHLAVPEQMEEIDKTWLNSLQDSPVPASTAEKNYVEIKRGGTLYIDHFEQLTMPWMLIATVDAYVHGTLLQKTRALAWVEGTLSHESVANADLQPDNWWRAELLIALNYLSQHDDEKHRRK